MQNTKEFAIFCDISAEKADMEILQGLLEVINRRYEGNWSRPTKLLQSDIHYRYQGANVNQIGDQVANHNKVIFYKGCWKRLERRERFPNIGDAPPLKCTVS